MRTIDVGVEKLTTVQDVHYLGVCLDGELSMRTHIASVTRSAFYHLRRLRPVGHLLGRAITAQLVASFVLSRLDYCNVILAGLPDASIRPLQRVLNTAARVVFWDKDRETVQRQRSKSSTGFLFGRVLNTNCASSLIEH